MLLCPPQADEPAANANAVSRTQIFTSPPSARFVPLAVRNLRQKKRIFALARTCCATCWHSLGNHDQGSRAPPGAAIRA